MDTDQLAFFLDLWRETQNLELGRAIRSTWHHIDLPVDVQKDLPDRYTYTNTHDDAENRELDFVLHIYRMTGNEDLRRGIEYTYPDVEIPEPYPVAYTYTCQCGQRTEARGNEITDNAGHFCPACGRLNHEKEEK